jgi:MFS family permease
MPIFLTVVIDLLGFGIVLPLLPLYGREYGASHVVVGLLFISFSGLQFVSAPLWGRLSDRLGRRPVILLGLLGSFASYALFAVAAWQSVLALLFVSRLTAGVFGGTISTAYAYIADVTPSEERGRAMALIGVAFGVGFTLGPAVGGLGHALHPAAPGVIAAGFSLTALLFAWRRLAEPDRHVVGETRTWLDLATLRDALRRPTIGPILLLGWLTVTVFALLESTLGLLGREAYEFDYWEVGLLFSYLGFWSIVTQGWFVRRYIKRFGEVRFALIGSFVLAVSMLGLGVMERSLWLLAVVSPFTVLGAGMIGPALASLLSRRTPPDVQGGIMGVNQSLQSLARIVGPMVGLPLFGVSVPLPFYVGAGAMAVACLLAVRLAARDVPDAS